jgi:hypothetical protein
LTSSTNFTTIQPHAPSSTDFYALPDRLTGMLTKIIYVGVPDPKLNGQRRFWNLAGNLAGKEGLCLAPHLSGIMHTPFQTLVSEGPYMRGAHYERTDWRKREINMGVMVGVEFEPATSFRYRMLEERWWSSWSAEEDGYLGVFTRTHGWRWLRVRLAEEPKDAMELDPTAFDNNFMQWSMTIMATQPFWRKRKEIQKWNNAAPTATIWQTIQDLLNDIVGEFEDIIAGTPGAHNLVPGKDIGKGTIKIWNNGSERAWPKFLVSAPGRAWIQDGDGRMVPLPLLTGPDYAGNGGDGYMLVDTDPTARMLTCSTDPVDPLFFQLARRSMILDFLLHDTLVSTLPVWRRSNQRFMVPYAPHTLHHITVYHSDPTGSITCIMPQEFDRAYG